MDFFNIELKKYCKSEDFKECMEIMKNNLTRKFQMDMYDEIYSNFVSDNNPNTIVPNLDKVIKLMILAQIYKDCIFNKSEFPNYSKIEILKEKYNNEHSINSFVNDSYFLCGIYEEFEFSDKKYYINLPTNHNCYPYILLHNAGNLGFISMIKMLFGNPNFTKIPIVFKLYPDNTGPHGGIYDMANMFFDHDLSHMFSTIRNIAFYNIPKILDIVKQINFEKLEFKDRYIIIFLHILIFEKYIESDYINNFNDKIYHLYKKNKYNNANPFDIVDFKNFSSLIKDFDITDFIHIINFLTNNCTELNGFKQKYNDINKLYQEFINESESIFIDKNYVFNTEKYEYLLDNILNESENIINENENKYTEIVIKIENKILEIRQNLVKEFISNNLQPLIDNIEM